MAKQGKAGYVEAQLYAMLEAIRKRIARDAGWRVVARGREWLCPYCGEIGFSNYEEAKAPRTILQHLLNDCPHWSEEAGTRFSHKLLVAKARRLETEEMLRTQRAWRTADKVGRWYCPYCGQATNVPWLADSKDPTPPQEFVHAHLDRCPARRAGCKPLPFEALQLIIEDSDRYREIIVAVRCKMAQEANWRQMTREGKWLCPRCREAVPEVDMSSEAERRVMSPVRIARHLMERCKPRAAGVPEAPALEAAPPPAAPPEPEGEVLTLESTPAFQALATTEETAPQASPAPAPSGPADEAERAREALRQALPAQPPLLDGYDLYCLHRAARDFGGTFYDYFYVSPENLAIVICNLPTRGPDAVRTIGAFRKSLRHHAQYHQSPAEVLRRTNKDLVAHHDTRSFITALYGVLDAHAGFFTYARAGHSMPILFNRQDKPPVRELSSCGLALGIQEGAGFDQAIEDVAIRFRSGDVLVLYAGGVTEAENVSGEPYGIARLGAAVERPYIEATSQALAAGVHEDVRLFLGHAPQKDDITLLCLRKP
ncbi:MAG: serine/threonine-protein phosphatase [Planctomycetes bacterium]|nr:serine/threonine-protein phosphatase [Planctomycetota bacterium]